MVYNRQGSSIAPELIAILRNPSAAVPERYLTYSYSLYDVMETMLKPRVSSPTKSTLHLIFSTAMHSPTFNIIAWYETMGR